MICHVIGMYLNKTKGLLAGQQQYLYFMSSRWIVIWTKTLFWNFVWWGFHGEKRVKCHGWQSMENTKVSGIIHCVSWQLHYLDNPAHTQQRTMKYTLHNTQPHCSRVHACAHTYMCMYVCMCVHAYRYWSLKSMLCSKKKPCTNLCMRLHVHACRHTCVHTG